MGLSKGRGGLVQTGSSIVLDSGGSNQYTIQVGSGSGKTVTLPTFTASSDTMVTLTSTGTLTNKTFTAPVLGTPASGTLTNCTGLPISTGVSGLGTGVATFLATPSSANFASMITDETGTGAVVLATSPTLVTPILGTPTSGTLTNCTGLPVATGISGLGSGVATFLATPSSANFASMITDETGTGSVVLGTSPTITTSIVTASTSFAFLAGASTAINYGTTTTANTFFGPVHATKGVLWYDTDGTHSLDVQWDENEASANRTLDLKVNGGNRIIDLSGNLTVGTGGLTTTTAAITLAANGAGSSVTLPASGTLATLTGSETLDAKTLTDVQSMWFGQDPGNTNDTIYMERSPTDGSSSLTNITAQLSLNDATTTAHGTTQTAGSFFAANSGGSDDCDYGQITALYGRAESAGTGTVTNVFGVHGRSDANNNSGTLIASVYAQSPLADTSFTGSYALLTEREVGFKQATTPGNPASGYNKIYFKNDDKLYKLDSSGNEIEVGAGQGEINYIGEYDAEAGTGSWATYKDAAATTPADGTGGTSTLTFSTTSTAGQVLRGSNSFKLAKSAANEQGEGWSYDFTIDPADENKLLKIYFDYKFSSSNYDASTELVSVYIYDVTNATLITPRNTTVNASTSDGTFFETDFMSTTSNSYRLIFHIAGTGTSAWDMYFDNVVVGPGRTYSGAVVGSWTASSTKSTIAGLTGTQTEYWRRVGDTIEVIGELAGATAGSGQINITSLPEGYTPDTTVLSALAGTPIGLVSANEGTTQYVAGVIAYNGASDLTFYTAADNNSVVSVSNATWNSTNNIPFTWSSDFLRYNYKLPIAEWAGSGTMNALVQDNLTEWTTYTPSEPSNLGTSSVIAMYRRVGQDIEIHAEFIASGAATGDVQWTHGQFMPSNLTVDTSLLTASRYAIGTWQLHDNNAASTADDFGGICQHIPGSSLVRFVTSANDIMDATTPVATESGDQFSINIKVPVTEWAGSQSSLIGFTEATENSAGLIPSYVPKTSISPVIRFGGVTAVNAISSNSTSWTKVGDLVTVIFGFTHTKDATDSGALSISLSGLGLPTPAANTTITNFFIERVNIDGTNTDARGMFATLNTSLLLSFATWGDQTSATAIDAGDISTSGGVYRGCVQYFV